LSSDPRGSGPLGLVSGSVGAGVAAWRLAEPDRDRTSRTGSEPLGRFNGDVVAAPEKACSELVEIMRSTVMRIHYE
jgi:hypothetical protein